MRRTLLLGATVLLLGLAGCTRAEEPPDYSDLARLADRLPGAVGTPPGVAAVHARGGSLGDAGYFEIEVELARGASGDEVVGLVQGRLPDAMARLGRTAGAPLVVSTPDGDRLRPDWGPYADATEEAVRIRAWLSASRRIPAPVVVEGRRGSVELAGRPDGAVAATYRALAAGTAGPGQSAPDTDWEVTRSSGVRLRLGAEHAPPSEDQLRAWQRLVATTRPVAGPFRAVALEASTWGTGLRCVSTVTASPPVAAGRLTVARFGPSLLPLLAAQARLCARDAYEARYAADPTGPPVALPTEWRSAIRAAVRELRGSATLVR